MDELHSLVALGTEKNPSTHRIGRWVGLRTGLDFCRRENLLPLMGFENRTVQPGSLN
jgi:hypothetical protein